jgi:hypothetical protein
MELVLALQHALGPDDIVMITRGNLELTWGKAPVVLSAVGANGSSQPSAR